MNKKKIVRYTIFIFAFALLLSSSFAFYKLYQKVGRLNQRVLAIESDLSFHLNNFMNYKSFPGEKLKRLDFLEERDLEAGAAEMKKHKVVFVGIARDNSEHLSGVVNAIENVGLLFKDYKVIIFENDSRDATKLMLNLWDSINPRVHVISEDFHNKKRPSIKFMAMVRNKTLQALQGQEYDGYDLVIAIDMDMKYGIDIRGIEDSFRQMDKWDVVCSNGIFKSKGNMYDVFAFRNEEFPYGPHEYKMKHGKDYWSKENISAMQKVYLPQEELIPVKSCFNGFAIYKRNLFKGCFYDSINEDCEHVHLHQCMKEKHNARIFINPAQIIRYTHYKDS